MLKTLCLKSLCSKSYNCEIRRREKHGGGEKCCFSKKDININGRLVVKIHPKLNLKYINSTINMNTILNRLGLTNLIEAFVKEKNNLP